MARNSAAYVLAIVMVLAFIVGALILTVIDPVIQSLFASPGWGSTTSQGADLLRWLSDAWVFVPVALLIAIVLEIWITTRQPT